MEKLNRPVAFLAGLVYFAQGALSIVGIVMPLFMQRLGWTVSDIAVISSAVALPWVFKILYGLLSDCIPFFSYRRKSYLMLFAAVAAAGWFALALLPHSMTFVVLSLLITNLGFAATDVITDGLIVEHSQGANSHIYQSIAWGTRSAGAMVSGVTGGWLASHWKAEDVFLLTMILPLSIVLWAAAIKEDKKQSMPFGSAIEPLKKCLRLLTTPNIKWFILILIISRSAALFATPFFFHLKDDLHFSPTFLGSLTSLGWTGVIITSFIYAKWIKKFSPTTILYWAFSLNVVNILSAFLIRDPKSAVIVIFFGGILDCMILLPIMSVSAMLTTRTGIEGTLFAILMSIHNLAMIFFGFLGGKFYNFLGIWNLIWISGVIGLLAFLFVPKLRFENASENSMDKG